jgi:hypothetical protein
MAPPIFNLVTRWGVWSVSRLGHFTPTVRSWYLFQQETGWFLQSSDALKETEISCPRQTSKHDSSVTQHVTQSLF